MASKSDKTLWGIHAGKTGEADNVFLKHGVIALGWASAFLGVAAVGFCIIGFFWPMAVHLF